MSESPFHSSRYQWTDVALQKPGCLCLIEDARLIVATSEGLDGVARCGYGDLPDFKFTPMPGTEGWPYDVVLDPITGALWLAKYLNATLTLVEPTSGTILATLRVLGFPQHLILAPTRRRLVVVYEARHVVTLVDVERRKVLRTVDVGAEVVGTAIDENHGLAYVLVDLLEEGDLDAGSTAVHAIDLDSGQLSHSWRLPLLSPLAILCREGPEHVLVAGISPEVGNCCVVLDGRLGQHRPMLSAFIEITGNIARMAALESLDRLVFACSAAPAPSSDTGSIAVARASDYTLVGEETIGSTPNAISVCEATRQVYVAAGEYERQGALYCADAETGAIQDVAYTGKQVYAVQASKSGDLVVVSNRGSDTVSILRPSGSMGAGSSQKP